MYFVDMVRRHTHPHSWVLNTPIFFLWLYDKLLWFPFYRRSKSPPVHRIKLGHDYMVLLWSQEKKTSAANTVGPDYSLRLNDSSFLERSHVFTAFENRCGLKIATDPNFVWTSGTVIRVFDRKRSPQLGAKDPHSHTRRLYDVPDTTIDLTVRGPHYGEMSERIRFALMMAASTPVILVAAGSGVGYVMDVLQWFLHNSTSRQQHLTVLFTTRDKDLLEWVNAFIANIFASSKKRMPRHLRIITAITSSSKDDPTPGGVVQATDLEEEGSHLDMITSASGRIRYDQEIPSRSIVFYQGGAALKEHVSMLCRIKHAQFHGGLGGS